MPIPPNPRRARGPMKRRPKDPGMSAQIAKQEAEVLAGVRNSAAKSNTARNIGAVKAARTTTAPFRRPAAPPRQDRNVPGRLRRP